ncbi:MAG: hypothetical protein LPK06_06115 [Marinobacter sp.]|nr:hypothetical protein [Marinobacter sp.]
MSEGFYLENSDELYRSSIWEGERKTLEDNGAILLSADQANHLDIDEFFSRAAADIKPVLSKKFDYFALPYELDDQVLLEGRRGGSCIDVVIEMVREYFKKPYIASTDANSCCVVQAKNLNADVIWSLFSGHLNTPFIVFDEARLTLVLIDFDLPFQIVGYRGNSAAKSAALLWRKHFVETWPDVVRKYRHYENLPDIVRSYYGFILKQDGLP